MAKKRRPSTDDEADEASSDSEEEEADEAAADEEEEAEDTDANPYPTVIRRATHKKKKVLVLASRGVTSAYMELMEDIMKLMPHCRKDPKFDKKEPLTSIVEIAQLAACKLCLYFETRKMKDLYLWAGRCEGGPSVKFLVQQVRPMRDLRLTGNCLLGSRPILSFDNAFETSPTLSVLKSLLSDIFAPPKGHPRSKPFFDHVLSFSSLEGRILVRHYQLVPADKSVRGDEPSLVEIGPRFALVPIRVLAGCFCGETLFANDAYVSPNVERAELKRKRAKTTVGAVVQKEKRRKRIQVDGMDEIPKDGLEDTFDA